MKIFYSEHQVDYATYTFSYAVYCIKEHKSELPAIYAQGFLPYTGDLTLTEDHFYLARSLRVDLGLFATLSENRRVDRKIEPLAIAMNVIDRGDFDINDASFVQFCQSYAEERFAGGSMSAERLAYVLNRELVTHIFRFASSEQTFGYVLAVVGNGMLHYWFSFYDTEYMRSHALGKWMMWRVIVWAKEQKLDYIYIGTCYREKSLYKVRDHKGAEFYDGRRWNPDTDFLKELCRSDESLRPADMLKTPWKDRWLAG